MGIFKKAKAWLRDDWCTECAVPMDAQKKQLFLLPMNVGHYESHNDAGYYRRNLIRVSKKADIPAGTYASGTYLYHCPGCGKHVVKVVNFLPVRDQEQIEEAFAFEDQDLYDFINKG